MGIWRGSSFISPPVLGRAMTQTFDVPTEGNRVLEQLVNRINADVELKAYWRASNITAIERLGFSDHGPIHIKIVTRTALKMLRMLMEKGEMPDIVKSYGMKNGDAEVVVVLASALHDIGHAVHRENHEEFSISLAPEIIKRLLKDLYPEHSAMIIMVEVLHAMISHRSDIVPLTLEAGVVRVADALDMEKGRARIPFRSGSINIHSVSALAIDKVRIMKGVERPIRVEIQMNNSAGIYQIDELLREKIQKSNLKDKITVVVLVPKEESSIIQELKF